MNYSDHLLRKHGNFLTRFAHRSRFERTVRALGGQTFERALDYGCGDAHLLLSAAEQGLCRAGTGVDFDPAMLEEARTLFAGRKGFDFWTPDAFARDVPDQSFDLVFCTEALEHIRGTEQVLDVLVAKLRPGGMLVVSVPIEIGPALLIKQLGRSAANLRGTYGYEHYSWGELVSAGLRRDTSSWPNSHNGREGADSPSTGHRGFDYRRVERALRARVRIVRTLHSPVPLLGSAFNSTVLWVARKESD